MDAESSKNSNTVAWWVRYSRWRQTSVTEARHAEERLLKLVRGPLEIKDVKIGAKPEETLHTLIAGTGSNNNTLVWMPGYASGTGFFWRNFDGLLGQWKIHAVDWLGTGLSGRPPYTAKSRQEAEDFFLDSLARWRTEAGLDKFVLCGHSLGGYLAACYALKYPEHVEHLVLVCPAGVPQAPENWQKTFFDNQRWSLRAGLFRFAGWAWEAGFTPGALVRTMGPWGPGIVNKYVNGRFSHHGQGLTQEEIPPFSSYFYHITSAKGSGEYALRHLLSPGAWAHAPLQDRLHDLKVPVTFIYGKHDWMNPQHAVRLTEELRKIRDPKAPSDMHVKIIDDAGHYVFVEQPEQFNKVLLDAVSHLCK